MSFIIFIPHFRLPPISPRTGRADKQKDNGAGDEISTNDGHGERWVAFLETPSRPRRKDSLALRFEERARTTYYLLQDVDGRPPCECAGTFCERARIFVNVHEYLRTCTNICECARIPTNVWENARVFLGRTGNFRATYTRPISTQVIYYVARREHMSHLHIAWYRKGERGLPMAAANMRNRSTMEHPRGFFWARGDSGQRKRGFQRKSGVPFETTGVPRLELVLTPFKCLNSENEFEGYRAYQWMPVYR